MSRPLRSTPITRASPLLRAGPPASAATVLSVLRIPPLTRSLSPPAHQHGQQYRHRPSHVPCRSRRPGSRRLHAGHHLANTRAPARLIPESRNHPGFDVTYYVSTRQQRFARARLPDPHLTPQRMPFPHRSPRRSSANAACGGLTPPPEGRRRRATNLHLLHNIASDEVLLHRPPPQRSWRTCGRSTTRDCPRPPAPSNVDFPSLRGTGPIVGEGGRRRWKVARVPVRRR